MNTLRLIKIEFNETVYKLQIGSPIP